MCRFAQQRVEYILHSWVTKPHDVILMLTQGLFCACYPVDKGQIKRRATMETSGVPHSPSPLLISLFIYLFSSVLVELVYYARAKSNWEPKSPQDLNNRKSSQPLHHGKRTMWYLVALSRAFTLDSPHDATKSLFVLYTFCTP